MKCRNVICYITKVTMDVSHVTFDRQWLEFEYLGFLDIVKSRYFCKLCFSKLPRAFVGLGADENKDGGSPGNCGSPFLKDKIYDCDSI